MKVLLHVLDAYTLQPALSLVSPSQELVVIEKEIEDCGDFITLLIISSLAILMACSLEPIKFSNVKSSKMNEKFKLNNI